jgi:hypothetical protein
MLKVGRAGRWAAGLALAAALGAGPAFAGWPAATPAQPLVQAPLRCALGVAPLNRRCHVVDFAKLGVIDGRAWYYAFYATHWADRHGRQDRGFPILFYLQRPATLRLGLWINDEPGLAGFWGRTPPVRPVLIRRPEGVYVGFTLKAVRGQDDQRLFRLDERRWVNISVLYRTPPETARLAAAAPKDCQVDGDGVYDWPSFTLVVPLKSNRAGEACGTLTAALEVRNNALVVVQAAPTPAAPPAPTPVATSPKP